MKSESIKIRVTFETQNAVWAARSNRLEVEPWHDCQTVCGQNTMPSRPAPPNHDNKEKPSRQPQQGISQRIYKRWSAENVSCSLTSKSSICLILRCCTIGCHGRPQTISAKTENERNKFTLRPHLIAAPLDRHNTLGSSLGQHQILSESQTGLFGVEEIGP